jgi:hypothetical protein
MIQNEVVEAPGWGLFYFVGNSNVGGCVMVGEVKLDEFGLLAAIDALKRVSPEEQEAAILALDREHPGVGSRARALLAIEKQATEAIRKAEADEKRVVAEAKARAEAGAQQDKVLEEAIAEIKTTAPAAEQKNKWIEELVGLWDSDPIEYAKKKREVAARLGVAEAIVQQVVKRKVDEQSGEEVQSQATQLMAFGFRDGVKLWHSPDGIGHASVLVGGHLEHYRIRSSGFDAWLRDQYGQSNQTMFDGKRVPQVPGTQALKDAIASLHGYALRHGATQEVAMRVGGNSEVIWIDLGTRDWSAIKVTAEGWDMVQDVGVPFVRGETMLPLPKPTRDGDIRDLLGVVNIKEEDLVLAAGWLQQVLNPVGDYPFVNVFGDSEMGKTFLCITLLTIVDPRTTKLRKLSGDEDLMVAALNNWAMGFDNWSRISGDVADTLCMISTEISSGKRKLYSDDEEHTFTVRRPIIFNGIPGDLTERSDLASRTILLAVPRITQRKRKADLEREFKKIWPGVFGALLDGLVAGLRDQKSIVVEDPARLMDFEAFAEAGCRGMGFEEWEFVNGYKRNRHGQMEMAAEASPIGVAVVKWLKGNSRGFAGKASVLLDKLGPYKSGRDWPRTAGRLSSELSRLAKPLAAIGITCQTRVDRRHLGGTQIDVVVGYIGSDVASMKPKVRVEPVVVRFRRRF